MQFLGKILIRTEFLLEPDISSFEVLWYQWYSSFAVCMEEDCFASFCWSLPPISVRSRGLSRRLCESHSNEFYIFEFE